jgi:hypothetical protein
MKGHRAETDIILSPTHPAFRPHVAALGQLAVARNGLHETLCLLFCTVMEAKAINQYIAIWHAIKVDRAQREMLAAAAESTIRGALPRKFQDDVKWLCGRIDRLEDLRNDAIHSPYWAFVRGFNDVVVMPNINLGHARAKKLFSKNLLTEFRWCRDSAIALSKFAWQMDLALSDYTLPWPDRPDLPDRPTTANKPSRASPATSRSTSPNK